MKLKTEPDEYEDKNSYYREKLEKTKVEIFQKLKKFQISKNEEIEKFIWDYFDEESYALEIAKQCDICNLERFALGNFFDAFVEEWQEIKMWSL